MKRFALLVGVTAALCTTARAADTTKAAKPEAKKLHCAVQTDHEIDVKKATADKMFTDYKGNRYFFCCAGCPAEFKKDPSKFAKADHIAVPKTK